MIMTQLHGEKGGGGAGLGERKDRKKEDRNTPGRRMEKATPMAPSSKFAADLPVYLTSLLLFLFAV
jgi:hypothetical protein